MVKLTVPGEVPVAIPEGVETDSQLAPGRTLAVQFTGVAPTTATRKELRPALGTPPATDWNNVPEGCRVMPEAVEM
jgi:hypothetical protein